MIIHRAGDEAGRVRSSAFHPVSWSYSAASARPPPRRPNKRLANSRYPTTATLMIKVMIFVTVIRPVSSYTSGTNNNVVATKVRYSAHRWANHSPTASIPSSSA